MNKKICYRKILVDGIEIFYRETGLAGQPVLLLLHGFPSSSHMFRDLIADLAGVYHIVAPDYPGFGQSAAPGPDQFEYTFANLSTVIEKFIDALALRDITLYMQDYGGPLGLRIATRRPSLIRALIIQNANAYAEGLGAALEPLAAYIGNPHGEYENAARFFLSFDATKWQYTNGAGDVSKISPDSYIVDQYYLGRPGNDEMQLALFRDYGSNVELYDEWQQYFREHQPDTLVIWGRNDAMFIEPGANAYKKDLPDAKVFLLEAGHFLLEEHHAYAAQLITDFINGSR